jgi:hypothetical protein
MIGESIVKALISRDGLTRSEARSQVDDFITDFAERVESGDYSEVAYMCEEYFGLEPDYLDDILFSFIA